MNVQTRRCHTHIQLATTTHLLTQLYDEGRRWKKKKGSNGNRYYTIIGRISRQSLLLFPSHVMNPDRPSIRRERRRKAQSCSGGRQKKLDLRPNLVMVLRTCFRVEYRNRYWLDTIWCQNLHSRKRCFASFEWAKKRLRIKKWTLVTDI